MFGQQPIGILGMGPGLGLELAGHGGKKLGELLLQIRLAALGTVHLVLARLENQGLEIFSAIAANVFVDGHGGLGRATSFVMRASQTG
jgi:hypothetical protein